MTHINKVGTLQLFVFVAIEKNALDFRSFEEVAEEGVLVHLLRNRRLKEIKPYRNDIIRINVRLYHCRQRQNCEYFAKEFHVHIFNEILINQIYNADKIIKFYS